MNKDDKELLHRISHYKQYCLHLRDNELKIILRSLKKKNPNLSNLNIEVHKLFESKSIFFNYKQKLSDSVKNANSENFSNKLNEVINHCEKMCELIIRLENFKTQNENVDILIDNHSIITQISLELEKVKEFTPKKLYSSKLPFFWQFK